MFPSGPRSILGLTPRLAIPSRTYAARSPWVNNCVGEVNQKSFMLFCLYIFVSSGYGLVLTAMRGPELLLSCDDCGGGEGLVFIFLMIECILFMLFTLIIFCDQACSVTRDTSTIDRKFAPPGSERDTLHEPTTMDNLRRVFGPHANLTWCVCRGTSPLSLAEDPDAIVSPVPVNRLVPNPPRQRTVAANSAFLFP